MLFQDPQDEGPGYRNVVGLPGGVRSPLFQLFKVKRILSAPVILSAAVASCA
jgi:hypothetical protein